MTAPSAVGIDLGTTNSVVACLDETGRSIIVRNSEGELLTPSVVSFEANEIVVGKAARQAERIDAARVASCVKRDMGQTHYSKPVNGQYLPPEVIQACILRKLRHDVAAVVGQHFQAVITVPAYFDEPRRKATADAGEMAGLDVLDIVNEPTAAALAFGEQSGYLTDTGQPREPLKVLVYDLGGGTFDVTLIDLEPGNIRTLATDGDVQLGGNDWDQLLADYAATRFQSQMGSDPRSDPTATSRLLGSVEDAKRTLSSRGRAVMHVEFGGRTLDVAVTLSQFEEMSHALLERTAFTTRQVLAVAGMDWPDVARVLLVGGATRMPMVATMLQRMSGLPVDRSINPDEAVARGAALFAWYRLQEQVDPTAVPFHVTDVNAHSLGIQAIDKQTLQRENMVVIPRNTPLPVKVSRPFATQSTNQKSIVVQVLEGESSQPALCSQIGRTVLRDLPPDLPQGYPVQITFAYGSNGRLAVEAELAGTGHKATVALERDRGLSSAQLSRWQETIDSDEGAAGVQALLGEAPQMHGVTAESPAAATSPATPPTVQGGGAATGAAPSAEPPGVTAASSATLRTAQSLPQDGGVTPTGAAVLPAAGHPPPPPSDLATGAKGGAPEMGEAGDSVPAAPAADWPPWVYRTMVICGHVTASVIGLAAAYCLLCWLKPGADILGIFSR